MGKKYYRECPNGNCESIMIYKYKGDATSANKKKTVCRECRYKKINERNGKIIYYLNNSELTHKEIGDKLNINTHIISSVRKKHKINRGIKLSNEGKKIRSNNFRKNVLDKKLNFNGGCKTPEHYLKIFKARYGYNYSDFKKLQPEYKKYYNKVRNITDKNLKKYNHLFNNLDNLGRCGDKGKYQVDHNFSIKSGFTKKVIPELISHPSNLRVIKWEDNLSKSDNCDITINELIFDSAKFLTKNHKILI